MAGPCTCHIPCHNLSPGNKDELAEVLSGAVTKSNNISTLFPAISWAQTPALAPALAPTISSTKELC